MEEAISGLLQGLSGLMESSPYLAPIFALLAGMLTSFTPCALSSLPLVLAYVGGSARDNPRTAFAYSLTIAGGMAVTFTVLGLIAALAGRLFSLAGAWVYLVLGILMVLMALQTWGGVNLIPSSYVQTANKRRGYLGALIAGLLGGLFSSPCATPVLIALLALVAQEGELLRGLFLLLLYSIGHGVLVVAAGTFGSYCNTLIKSPRFAQLSRVLKGILGGFILILGFYLMWMGF